jgi:hypothetical protein
MSADLDGIAIISGGVWRRPDRMIWCLGRLGLGGARSAGLARMRIAGYLVSGQAGAR